MCGIAGWIGNNTDTRENAVQVDRLIKTIHHRGPDARGAKILPGGALIHTRLSIIDLSETGAQPMSNEDGTVWTVFNGEIYNHHSIRNELIAKGHIFRGRSDTEIIPHLYEELGTAFVERLRGMFTIAVFDVRHQTLTLVRDWFGIKPLFYAKVDNQLYFASELRALLEIPHVNTRPNRQAIFDYAALFYIPAPQTFYQGIYALQPGEILEAHIHHNQVNWQSRYYRNWQINLNTGLSLEGAIIRAEELIHQAVAGQLESDVPLGSLLSGGIDSSLVSTFAQKAIPTPLLTYNVRFSDERYDETWAAQAVANHIRSHHQTLDMDSTPGTWDYITGLLRHAGQPFADTSLFAVNIVCRLMRQHVTVALSGDGGDEGFGGYELYQRAPFFGQISQIPNPIRQMGLYTGSLLGRFALKRFRPTSTLAYRLRELADAGDHTGMVQMLFVWIRDREHHALCQDTEKTLQPVRRHFEPQWDQQFLKRTSATERISAHMTEVNTRLLLPNDFLFKVDLASMRNGLEVRVPMLDESLFSFGLTLPHRLKAKRHTSKLVLRAVAQRHLPRQVVEKHKWGFGIPVDKWVDNEFKIRLHESLLGSKSKLADYFRPEIYQPMVRAFSEGYPLDGISRMGLYQRVMMLLALDIALQDAS